MRRRNLLEGNTNTFTLSMTSTTVNAASNTESIIPYFNGARIPYSEASNVSSNTLSWVSVSKASSSNNLLLNLSIPNYSGSSYNRSGDITFSYCGLTASFHITQTKDEIIESGYMNTGGGGIYPNRLSSTASITNMYIADCGKYPIDGSSGSILTDSLSYGKIYSGFYVRLTTKRCVYRTTEYGYADRYVSGRINVTGSTSCTARIFENTNDDYSTTLSFTSKKISDLTSNMTLTAQQKLCNIVEVEVTAQVTCSGTHTINGRTGPYGQITFSCRGKTLTVPYDALQIYEGC